MSTVSPPLDVWHPWRAVMVGLLALTLASTISAARDASPEVQRRKAMGHVKTWAYQLQRLEPAVLKVSPFDLLVIDHAPDRVESVEDMFRRADIAALKLKPDGTRRIVLAYVSIGEAERYRFYWDEAWLDAATRPAWLGLATVNPQWAGNYPVEYWRSEWQSLIYGRSDSYIDRVLEAGFDGIYLDRADVYEQFKSRPSAQGDMESFIAALTDHARAINPQAIIVLQNAEELIQSRAVRNRIDAIAKESLYFNPDTPGTASPTDDEAASLEDLRRARQAGRKVLVVEYVADADRARIARRKANKEGFLIHFAERSLSVLNVVAPDHQPQTANTAAPLVRDAVP